MSYKVQHKESKCIIGVFDTLDEQEINQLVINNGSNIEQYEIIEFTPEELPEPTIEEQRQSIINQLAQLDKSLTRTEENIISHMIDALNYQPYQREIDIATQKQTLRNQLQSLQ